MLDIYLPLPTPAEMQAWDKAAIDEFGLPGLMLMENAAREALRLLEELALAETDVRALIFAGSGNNGGDGFALARHLHDLGRKVLLCHFTPLSGLKGAARKHAQMAKAAGVETRLMPKNGTGLEKQLPSEWKNRGKGRLLVVDALNGTGLRGPLRQETLAAVRYINRLAEEERAFVLAIDVPSGLNALTGNPEPEAVRANATLCLEAGKPGLFFPQAAPFTGRVYVRRIGLPAAVRHKLPPSFRALAPKPGSWQGPQSGAHKGQQGRVLIIGGSAGFSGAPRLAALGALRSGCALVTAACPEGLATEIRYGLPELMALPLPTAGGPAESKKWSSAHIDRLCSAVKDFGLASGSALVIGPGFGRGGEARAEIIEALLRVPERPPVVLDADGLFPFGHRAGTERLPLTLLTSQDILTPHPGEMGNLLGCDAASVQADRPGALRALCAACPAAVVLKGPGTLIGQKAEGSAAPNQAAEPMRPVTVAPFRVGQLAVGGSGDVLSGICATLLARRSHVFFASQEASTLDLAGLAVHIHGRCGELLERDFPAGGNTASDIAETIPRVLRELCS